MRAGDLAPLFDRPKERFKTDVRKLKELGLTESLVTGYRLSPRGRALLERLGQTEEVRCNPPGAAVEPR